MEKIFGSIEAGGTKFVLAIGDDNLNILKTATIKTEQPADTLMKVVDFFKQNKVISLSIGSFGPIDIDDKSATFGFITSTPKQYWQNFDILGFLKKYLKIPIFFTTDVNSAVFGEKIVRELDNLVYYTVGTGIGGAAIQNNNFIGVNYHAEMGHTFVKKHEFDQNFAGSCPFHKDCLEGLAAGYSINARFGESKLDTAHEFWRVLAFYLAQAAIQSTLILRPQMIIFGGGVMKQEQLLPLIKEEFSRLLNNYIVINDIDKYLQIPKCKDNSSATVGNFALAKRFLSF